MTVLELRHIEAREVFGVRMFYQHSSTVDQEVVGVENNQFIFSADILHNNSQLMSIYITVKLILTSDQSILPLHLGSESCLEVLMISSRNWLSSWILFKIH